MFDLRMVRIFFGDESMGKGDRRSKRGKIFRGTYGKRRPKPEKERKIAVAFAAAATAAAAAPTS
jgi:30S ribosomal protein S31